MQKQAKNIFLPKMHRRFYKYFSYYDIPEEDVRKLQQIRWEIDPEEKLMERADSLTKIKRNYFRPPKKNWWQKLLGV